ncbi:MAG: DUF4129 domain-containing protein, partial [Thermoguttaceae bacterium]|nr:DUF4129 domain-containing protein [Thermoguttaceae bacterium]
MRKRKARTERRTKKTGAASVALATFCVVGGIGGIGGIGEITGETAAQAGGVRVAFAGEDSAEERRWRKAANQGKTPWKTEEGDAAFLPPRPQPEFVPPPPKSDAKPSVSLDGVRKGAEILFWALVGAAVVALAVAMWQTWRRTREAGGKDKSKKARQDRERRLEAIAPEARERVDDLGTAAENALAAGDLRLALVYFFSWLIVEADKRGLLRAQRGKTNREYWLELAVNPGVRTIYKATMDEFERVYFGGQAISQAEFDDVWRLREPFAATMARLDAGRAAAERASQEAARRAPNAQVAARW